MSLFAQDLGLLAAVAGLSSHLFFWIHGERSNRDIRIWLYSHCFVNIFGLFAINYYAIGGVSIPALLGTLGSILYLNACFYGTLFASILIYRVFFHRLRHFPGPFSLKLSKLVALYLDSKKSQTYLRIWDLHRKYGDIVRVGPQELSILDATAIDAIYGPSSRCTRAPWYDRFVRTGERSSEQVSSFSIRDHVAHSKRRRAVWDKTFSTTVVKSYLPLVSDTIGRFLNAIGDRVNQPISVPAAMQLLGYELIGEVGWGEPFGNIKNWKLNPDLEFADNMTRYQQILGQAPWLMNLIVNIPWQSGGSIRPYGTWVREQILSRLKNFDERTDAMTKIVHANRELDRRALFAEGFLMVLAGGDTTSTGIASIIFHLSRNPSIQKKLQNELDELKTVSDLAEYYSLLSTLPFLNACITEGLRIQPPTPGSILRVTPPEGLQLSNGTFIPGDTVVSVPILPVQRDSRYYTRPDEYIPDRYITKRPDWTLDKTAFFPFGGGHYMCPGKNMAYMELRFALAKLFSNFDARLADGEDGRKFFEETKDIFGSRLGDFKVIFTERLSS